MDDLLDFHDGDRDLFRTLVREHGALVLRIAESFTLSSDEAEDLFQEIWLRVYDKRRQYSGSGPFVAWLLTVARNTALSRYRREEARKRAYERLRASGILDDVAWTGPNPETEALQNEQRLLLYEAILELTDRERTAIILRFFEHRGSTEAGEIMGCEPATVRSLMRNGVARLRRILIEGDSKA